MPDPIIGKVNGSSVDVRLTYRALLTFMQGDCERGDKGVFSGYDKDDLQASYIRIPKPTFFPILPRTLGAGINGGSYSGSSFTISNDEYLLQVLDVYDNTIQAPFNNLTLLPQVKLDDWSRQIGQAVAVLKNGLCLATKFYASFYKDQANAKVFTFDPTSATDNLRTHFDECEDALSSGIPDLGIDLFPEEGRRILYVNGITKYVRQTGSFIVGGSNFAQDMLKSGAFSPDDVKNSLDDGFHGTYGNVDMNLISDLKVNLADNYLGLPKGTLKACGLYAVESSSYANQFGLVDNGVKTIPSTQGQGYIVQPNYRFGACTIWAQGNAFVTNVNFVNPFRLFQTVGGVAGPFAGITTPTILAPGSRDESLAAVVTTSTANSFVLTATKTVRTQLGAVTLGSAATSEVVGYAMVSTDAAVTTLPAFITAYLAGSANTAHGTTAGTVSLTVATGKYVNAVVITSDGTVSSVGSVKAL